MDKSKNIFSKFFLKIFLIIFSCIFFFNINHAQNLPQVNVRELQLEQSNFKNGSFVVGSFYLENASGENIPEVFYVVKLVGNFDRAGNPTKVYDQKKYDIFSLKVDEKKQINFDYKLPANISGNDLGIEVASYLGNGLPLGWFDVKIKIDGNVNSVNLNDAYVLYNSNRYEINTAPTLKNGETAKIFFRVSNPSSNKITLRPVVEIYNRNSKTGEKLLTQEINPIPLAAYISGTQSFALPLFDYKPGVYDVVLKLLDSSKEVAGPEINFKYVISGDVANVVSVKADKENVFRGDNLTVFVDVTGNPPDISEPIGRDNVPANIDIKIFNQDNVLVGEALQSVVLGELNNLKFIIPISDDATSLKTQIKIIKNENLLFEKSFKLSATAQELSDEEKIRKAEQGKFISYLPIIDKNYIFLSIAVILILLAVGSLVYVARYDKKYVWLIFFATATMLNIVLPVTTFAFTVTDLTWQPVIRYLNWPKSTAVRLYGKYSEYVDSRINIFINNPKNIYKPGESFYINGSVNSLNGGLPKDLYIVGRLNDKEFVRTDENLKAFNRFDIGPFAAPKKPGVYKVYIGVAFKNGPFKDRSISMGGKYGYHEFIVEENILPIVLGTSTEKLIATNSISNNSKIESCMIQNICEQQFFGYLQNGICTTMDGETNMDYSCIKKFEVSKDLVMPGSNISFKYDVEKGRNSFPKCEIQKNLNGEYTKILSNDLKNIQEPTKFILTCNYYNLQNFLIGNVSKEKNVRVMKIGN